MYIIGFKFLSAFLILKYLSAEEHLQMMSSIGISILFKMMSSRGITEQQVNQDYNLCCIGLKQFHSIPWYES